MKIKEIKLETADLEAIHLMLRDEIEISYSNRTTDLIILTSEAFKLRTQSTQLNMIVLKQENNSILVDIIGAAGGAGILNYSWGSEAGFIHRIFKTFQLYCEEKGIKLTELA